MMDERTDGRTDLWTDGRTDRPSYRGARTHLKINNKIIEQYNTCREISNGQKIIKWATIAFFSWRSGDKCCREGFPTESEPLLALIPPQICY